jgi:hypothetical protein
MLTRTIFTHGTVNDAMPLRCLPRLRRTSNVVLPVTLDRADPTNRVVHWAEMTTARQANDSQAEALAAFMRGEPGSTGVSAASPGSGPDDQLGRLQKLGELHASGVLTDAEFDAQKAKILGS